MLTALGPLSIDMYLPSLPDIGRVLGAADRAVQLTISSYLIGFAIGQIIYGPVSDLTAAAPCCSRRWCFITAARSSARSRNRSTS